MDLSLKIQLCSDFTIQKILREVDSKDLALLLAYHLDENACNCIFRNMSKKGIEAVLEDRKRVAHIVDYFNDLFDNEMKSDRDFNEPKVILFTDLVNSTERITMLGDTEYYEKVLTIHNDVLRKHFLDNGGRIIKSIGDAFLVVFGTTHSALNAGISAQIALKEMNKKRKSSLKILVRMGMHKGVIKFKLLDNNHIDIYGSHVNYAARVVGFAGGGQILVSEDMLKSVEEEIDIYRERIEKAKSDKKFNPLSGRKAYFDELEQVISRLQKFKFQTAGEFSMKGFKGDHELFHVKY